MINETDLEAMGYEDWRRNVKNNLSTDLRKVGFVPQSVADFVEMQLSLLDYAYAKGRKDAGNED